ncbi:MAG: DUF488 domain-containing protein [Phenylobacterium sp.]|uniref:DUF488 domain-containing protein n=1 Tax=Phenylobacterium sp. TaxID=1871053 RepID=UPI001B50568E|nr:DUF488 domain-containing protein [Phenylobacterium sp.]MBP7648880.1 DUF488 domain-containing protein [Phenylobacterium sp.]MBP7816215.1 DUF488 domain-containing protein [Phenylobacterium sp.]
MLSTIGYEGARPDDFIQTLQSVGIDLVIDIRDRAQSRRPGFSKSSLGQILTEGGIRYIHYKELGDPKEGRDAARAKDFEKFRRVFAGVLETEAAKAALKRIAEASAIESVCLLCYERDQTHCHRALVASKIEAMTGRKTRHLGVRQFEQNHKRAGRVPDTREGVAT